MFLRLFRKAEDFQDSSVHGRSYIPACRLHNEHHVQTLVRVYKSHCGPRFRQWGKKGCYVYIHTHTHTTNVLPMGTRYVLCVRTTSTMIIVPFTFYLCSPRPLKEAQSTFLSAGGYEWWWNENGARGKKIREIL